MNTVVKIKENTYKYLNDCLYKRRVYSARKNLIKEHKNDFIGCKDIKLTIEEKQLLHEQWGWTGFKIYDEWYRLFKLFGISDPKLISLDIYSPVIIDNLNPPSKRNLLSNKSYYPVYFSRIRQPKILLYRIHGTYFDEQGEPIDKNEVEARYVQFGICFIKPAKDSYGGKGVKKIDTTLFPFKQVETEYKSDFLIQEALKQSKQTAIFNPDSVNTFRVSTLYINGRVSCCSTYLKFGQKGSCVDNLTSRGYAVGVDPDGHFRDTAIDYHDGFVPTPDKIVSQTREGLCFKDFYIPEIQSVIDFAMENHEKYFPELGFIGWDIALNEKNEPVMIEVNVKFPSIMSPQILFRRSAFDNRVDEVIDYIKRMRG